MDERTLASARLGGANKNLGLRFTAAAQSRAVLLFAEADALFAKRSRVSKGLDRYTNIEVSFLPQRMEDFRGMAILATNMKSALDPAFLQRLLVNVAWESGAVGFAPECATTRRRTLRASASGSPD
jgi:SpoVK/Ycf46/Vps4 family AAA+-type ATPase